MVNDIDDRPFYSLSLIQALVEANHFSVVNDRADRWIENLGWNSDTLKQFILALTSGHFLRGYPQCSYGNGTRSIDCDAYKMEFDGAVIFAKFAISKNSRTLIVSLHLDGSIG